MAKRQFHWSPVHDCVMHETDGSGNTLVEYTHEPVQYGPLISEHRNGQEYVHHYDALGSTTMLTDETGSVTDTFTYDAWGNEVARTGTTETPYRWCGRWGYQYDNPTTNYYVRARTYQLTIARWTSVDPEFSYRVYERYIYAYSSPSLLNDPSGRFCKKECPECPVKWDPPALPKPLENFKYGCYCGKGAADPPQTPIDPTDKCCKEHDDCCGKATTVAQKTTCNNSLTKCALIASTPEPTNKDSCDGAHEADKKVDKECCEKAAKNIVNWFNGVGAMFC